MISVCTDDISYHAPTELAVAQDGTKKLREELVRAETRGLSAVRVEKAEVEGASTETCDLFARFARGGAVADC